jgi:hypothetical protein
MNKWTPGEWTIFLTSLGGFVTLIFTQIGNLIVAIQSRKTSVSNAGKLDKNNAMTEDIHKVTNGPLDTLHQNVLNLGTKIDTHAETARVQAQASQASKDQT